MRTQSVSLCTIFAAVLAVTSLPVLAQRGGGGGHMGGGHGGGMPSTIQPGGGHSTMAPSAQPGERPGGQFSGDRAVGSDRAGDSGSRRTPGELLQQNTKLSENLGKLLPAGTDLQAAATGFTNLGQFVSAVHVSNNLGIPFNDLKTRIAAGDSLGEAIKALNPAADSQAEVRRAQAQARQSQGT